MIKRTISGMMGKGSIHHNERRFTAENVDEKRTKDNVVLISDNIEDVYHELFDPALERYNAKQKRKDRRIEDYYEHIRVGKQEKLFHEVIFQIGNKENMGCETKEGEIARQVLLDFAKEFSERNPQFRVFGMYLHMDEATPHLHIDFIPYITESKRGLDTRVSMKQALASRGFAGRGRSETECNQWIESEKEMLAKVAERYNIEWEKKNTHREHLDVLNFKKEERTKEVAELEQKKEKLLKETDGLQSEINDIWMDKRTLEGERRIAEIEAEMENERAEKARQVADKHQARLNNLQPVIDNMNKELLQFSGKIEEQLPTAQFFESALAYRNDKAKPLFIKLKNKVASLAAIVAKLKNELKEAKAENSMLWRDNGKIVQENNYLKEQCGCFRKENKELQNFKGWFESLVRVFGKDKVDWAIEIDEERIKMEAEEKSVLKKLEWYKEHPSKTRENKKKKSREMEL